LQNYRDLIAWQKSMDLVEKIYAVTRQWPKDELYGLTSQVRRAIVSVPANIAEGQGRRGPRELLHHLSVASGSLHEAETHLLISERLCYIDEATAKVLIAQAAEVGRLLYGLMRSIRSSSDDN
jgi:four helix bundle protein